jgi:nitric oxide reductase NorD protein
LASDADDAAGSPVRAARLARRPNVRQPGEDEDEAGPQGPSMVQTAQPHEQAEDPMGMQRPTDRDAATAADEFADSLAELPEARLVSSPAKPKEVLLSDDPPEAAARMFAAAAPATAGELRQYPEWDWRIKSYREPGATVLLSPAAPGPQQWVDQTLAERGAMLREIRRRFELLRAQRTRVRNQLDGAEIDLQAWADGQADFRAGLPLSQRLYQSERRGRRDMAVMLLVDVSGSTDGWIAPNRRVIDIEREALLLVCIALDSMDERFCVQAFSGEGPQGVMVRKVKDFGERYDNTVAQRIAGLEPEQYTRAGAAIRHASTELMAEPAVHRLLLLLSDGKPNDVDEYEGRYGVEDMRQAVTEARLQGIAPFCLTIDRQAANYLPLVFGPHHYALLPRPELLPLILLDWLRKLMAR